MKCKMDTEFLSRRRLVRLTKTERIFSESLCPVILVFVISQIERLSLGSPEI